MKKDIQNRADIELLVNSFYDKIKQDRQLGFIFNDIAKVNWSTHLPVMYNFWENIIFHTGSYEGNPMNLHLHLHGIKRLNKEHFQQWILLFNNTVNSLFKGKNADLAKNRTASIADIIMNKLLEQPNDDERIY